MAEVLDEIGRPIVAHGPRIFDPSDYIEKVHFGEARIFALHDNGLHTYIAKRSMLGRKLNALNEKLRCKEAGYLGRILEEIHRIGALLELPRYVVDTACRLGKKLVKTLSIRKLSRFSKTAIAAGCIIAACRLCKHYVSSIEIAERIGLNKYELYRAEALLLYKTGILNNIPYAYRDAIVMYINRFCTELGLDEKVRRLALALLERGRIKSTDPRIVAAALIYIAAKLANIPLRYIDIEQKLGLRELAIRLNVREITKTKIEVIL